MGAGTREQLCLSVTICRTTQIHALLKSGRKASLGHTLKHFHWKPCDVGEGGMPLLLGLGKSGKWREYFWRISMCQPLCIVSTGNLVACICCGVEGGITMFLLFLQEEMKIQ